MSLDAAERAVRDADLDAALRHLQDQVRQEPANAALRVFLFQLLAVMGQWDRALAQLAVATELDANALAMATMYREIIRCERLRADVFMGKRSPVVLGEPPQWLALLIESLLVRGTPRADQSEVLRAQAFESAPPSVGSVDGQPFEWIADADMRLGPVCEVVINGRYYWVPFDRFSSITLGVPADLRDCVWMPAEFHFADGGDAVGVIPTRYPGSEDADDAQVRLGRRTVWTEEAPNAFSGLGQRMFVTDIGEHAVMDVREILITDPREGPAEDVEHA